MSVLDSLSLLLRLEYILCPLAVIHTLYGHACWMRNNEVQYSQPRVPTTEVARSPVFEAPRSQCLISLVPSTEMNCMYVGNADRSLAGFIDFR